MDKTDKSKIQKVGLIRYNPFDEMGGNLCFALALLDGNDNGVVLNGIHSRTGSFTYAKPIEMGVSSFSASVTSPIEDFACFSFVSSTSTIST